MTEHVADLLAESIGAAEKQLAAARKLDLAALNAATARRQDLLFQLGLVDPSPGVFDDPSIRATADKLRRLDLRLGHVLNACLGAIRGALPSPPAQVYSADGRMRGGSR